MSGFGSEVRRGVMAADQFTQSADGLLRDSRISYRAKGLFGYISTHRDDWQITVANLARHGRERVDAVTTGLEELEHHGSCCATGTTTPTARSGRPCTSSPTCPPCKTPAHNQSRVIQDWLSQYWLIPALRDHLNWWVRA
ncbi:hypothetical protein ABZ755_27640 [Streptomyces griseoincarnatus]